MHKRTENIDLVFRNGLKDFEVIPPAGVWDNISPIIPVRKKSYLLLSTAASVAVLMALSFVVYLSGNKISGVIDNPALALIPQSTSEASPAPLSNSTILTAQNIASEKPAKVLNRILPEVATKQGISIIVTPEVVNFTDASGIQVTASRIDGGQFLAPLNKTQKSDFTTNEPKLLFPLAAVTQKVPARWSIAAMASPTYYSQFGKGDNEISKQLMAADQPLISYAGGVSFAYKINKRLSIQSGLFYASMGEVVDGINSFTGFQKYDYTKGDHNFEVATANGTVFTKNADVFLLASGPLERISTSYTSDVFDPVKANLQYINNSLHQTFSYLEVPVLVRYKIIDKAIDFNLIGGISYNLLVDNSVYTMIGAGKYEVGETENLNIFSVSSSLGMGVEYTISSKLSLNLEPTFRYYLNPLNSTAGTNNHPYSIGIFSGISYRF